MQLKELRIRLNESYEDNPGKYRATICYVEEKSELKMEFDDDLSNRLLEFVGPALTQCATRQARALERNFIESVRIAKALPEIAV